MSKKYDIMVAGHVCFDLIPRFKDSGARQIQEIITPGKLVNIDECMLSTGGPVSNTGIGLQKLGNTVCFSARIGDDEFGRMTSDFLNRLGNADGIKMADNQTSSYTIALAPPNIDRIFLHNPGTNNLFDADDLNPDLISQCRHFHFGYPPLMTKMYSNDGLALQKVFKIAKQAGAITSCDMSLPDPNSESGRAPWRTILENILPYVDIFLPSIEEVFFMLEREEFLNMKNKHNGAELIDFLDTEDYSRLAGQLLEMGTKMTSLKSGHRGYYFKTADKDGIRDICEKSGQSIGTWANRELWSPAFEIEKIASATGSGDSSISGFLSAFMRNYSLEACLKYATMLGWENLQVLDAVSGIKTWDETGALLKQDLPLILFEMKNPGWKWNEKFKLWAGPEDILNLQ